MFVRWVIRLAFPALALAFSAATWLALAGAQGLAPQNSNRVLANKSYGDDAATNANTAARPFTELTSDMTPVGNVNTTGNMDASSVAARDAWGAPPDASVEPGPPSVAWGEVKPVSSFPSSSGLTLRSGPDASSSAVARFEPGEDPSAEILDATRNSLRVRFRHDQGLEDGEEERVYEGWVEWGVVVPHAAAIVLDAESGEVVGRVPLEEGITSVAFSPDGKRAVFYGPPGMSDVGGVAAAAVEVETPSFKRVRALETASAAGFASLFYDPSDGSLRALAQRLSTHVDGIGSGATFYPFHVGDERVEPAGDGASRFDSGTFALAPDGAKALLIHNTGEPRERIPVDVLDLKTLEVVGGFELARGGSDEWPYQYAVGPDASTFYYTDDSPARRVIAVNTRTGERVGEYDLTVAENQWTSFSQANVVGDSLFVTVWEPTGEMNEHGYDETTTTAFWLKRGGEKTPAEPSIVYAVEAGGSRYAVNAEGTILFKLDAAGRVRERVPIERPETKYSDAVTSELSVISFVASPDGKYLVIFVGIVDGC